MIDLIILFTIVYLFFMIYFLAELRGLRKYIETNFDYVGKDFSKKVREVYYDKKNKKAIYGTTTHEERKELAEEGIDLLSIPWISKDN